MQAKVVDPVVTIHPRGQKLSIDVLIKQSKANIISQIQELVSNKTTHLKISIERASNKESTQPESKIDHIVTDMLDLKFLLS